MSKHRTERPLDINDFDDAIKQLVDLLRESDGTAENKTKAFVLRGWPDYNLGASSVFRAISKLLKCDDSDIKKNFGKIFHVDCSQCKNRRAIQRAIAQELNLHHVLHIIDKQDEDDDFRGLDDSSREEISSMGSLIHLCLRDERFLMILRCGGVDNIDLVECGIPTFGKGKLLCTNYGWFHVIREEPMLIPSLANIDIYMHSSDDETMPLRHVLHEEAMGVIDDIGMEGMNPSIVLDCFLYSLTLTAQLPENNIGVDNGWATHACNYWICDGILGEDKAWEIGNALYRVMPPLGHSSHETRELLDTLDIKEWESTDPTVCCWYPVTNNKLGGKNICNVPDCASSYFLTFQEDDPLYIPNDLFQLASNLRVLKLCNCSFDFSSPPFQCCNSLRFLWLDHCTNTGKEISGVPFFPNLLVFDLRFTQYILLAQMVELMTNLRELNTRGVSWKNMTWKKLQKLHKLRVTESSDVVTVDSCFSIDMMNLELLDLSGNTHMESLPRISSARSLKMLVLDGCSGLEHVALAMERASPLLESFSFDGYGPAENWTHSIQLPQKELRLKSPIAPVEIVQVTKISLHGCGRLQNIYLRALPNLKELDLSGTAIKILDVGAMEVLNLRKLFLLGCEKLRILILDGAPMLAMLHVDTRGKKRSTVCCGGQRSFRSHAFIIAFTDGRFTWSFMSGLSHRIWDTHVYLLISCMSHTQANIKKFIKEIGSSQEGLVPTSLLLPYNNIASTEDVTCSSLVWNHRPLQTLNVHIEIGEGTSNLERMQDNEYFMEEFVQHVRSLHVHDNSSITAIPPADETYWNSLAWCHVERCPNLHTLFSFRGRASTFKSMRIFSASDLVVAYCIWGRSINNIEHSNSFKGLRHIYLYNCPRLVFVLPISFTLPGLETLQIAYCSNLRHVFPLDKYPEEISSGVKFENLKHIKLYHLHNLEQICEARLTTPALQTISLRDCWGLRRLPAVTREGPKPVVDCEKDWWNRLEWDGLDAGHDPSLFETRHSAYYKKTLPRVSVLR